VIARSTWEALIESYVVEMKAFQGRRTPAPRNRKAGDDLHIGW
jgi:hypothetical protein